MNRLWDIHHLPSRDRPHPLDAPHDLRPSPTAKLTNHRCPPTPRRGARPTIPNPVEQEGRAGRYGMHTSRTRTDGASTHCRESTRRHPEVTGYRTLRVAVWRWLLLVDLRVFRAPGPAVGPGCAVGGPLASRPCRASKPSCGSQPANIESASLELQRLWGVSKNDRDKLRATFGLGGSVVAAHGRRGPRAPQPRLPTCPAPSIPVAVGVLHYTKPSEGVSPACRTLM